MTQNYKNLIQFFNSAALKLKKPKLVLKLGLNKIVIAWAGESSRYPGCLHISDGGGFGNSIYYGRINKDGSALWRMETSDQLKQLIAAIDKNPVAEAKLQGQEFGHCMFCGIELTTKESLFVGYGPICADKWNLPWGEVADKKNKDTMQLDLGLGIRDAEIVPSTPHSEPSILHLTPSKEAPLPLLLSGKMKLIDTRPEVKVYDDVVSNQYYLQDSRTFVGNCMMWWRTGGKGYTTNIADAHVYTEEEALSQNKARETDIPWPKEYVDKHTQLTVDHQYCKKKDAPVLLYKNLTINKE